MPSVVETRQLLSTSPWLFKRKIHHHFLSWSFSNILTIEWVRIQYPITLFYRLPIPRPILHCLEWLNFGHQNHHMLLFDPINSRAITTFVWAVMELDTWNWKVGINQSQSLLLRPQKSTLLCYFEWSGR
jgi:hypothetical protein